MTEYSEPEKTCDQCGQEATSVELMVDEETGLLFCPLCTRERQSCGCSDEDE